MKGMANAPEYARKMQAEHQRRTETMNRNLDSALRGMEDDSDEREFRREMRRLQSELDEGW